MAPASPWSTKCGISKAYQLAQWNYRAQLAPLGHKAQPVDSANPIHGALPVATPNQATHLATHLTLKSYLQPLTDGRILSTTLTYHEALLGVNI